MSPNDQQKKDISTLWIEQVGFDINHLTEICEGLAVSMGKMEEWKENVTLKQAEFRSDQQSLSDQILKFRMEVLSEVKGTAEQIKNDAREELKEVKLGAKDVFIQVTKDSKEILEGALKDIKKEESVPRWIFTLVVAITSSLFAGYALWGFFIQQQINLVK